MALESCEHGFPLVVHDIDPAKVELLRGARRAVVESPQAVPPRPDRTSRCGDEPGQPSLIGR